MKRNLISLTLTLALVLCMALSLSMSAFADIIVEPEDSFYSAHANEMDYVQSEYYSNGSIGYMPVYNRPDGRVLGYSQNGQIFFVRFVYSDPNGAQWGMVEYSKGDTYLQSAPYSSDVGYINMADTLQVFSSLVFYDEHRAELTEYTGDGSELSEGAVFWTFPRSGASLSFMEAGDLEELTFDKVYTYPDGQQWGFCGYHYGFRNFWICISDPLNQSIPAELPDIPDFIVPEGEVPSVGMSPATLAVILVAGVVIVTLACILLMKNKRPRRKMA